MPVWLSRGRINRVRPGEEFCVHTRTVDLPNLPDELCGLTITHISDPHIGELITIDHLEHVVETANELGAEMIVVTGDFIDFSNQYLPDVVRTLKELHAPMGVYCVLGNHDHLDNVHQVIEAFEAAGLELLVNRTLTAWRDEAAIHIGGIDWAREDHELARMVRGVAAEMDGAELKILLAHHPHAFDAAWRAGIDLTLSGHTHGGQVLLRKTQSRKGSIGIGSLNCRYARGLYTHGPYRLHVSSGVGSWFPVRFRCPAEITVLELENMVGEAFE